MSNIGIADRTALKPLAQHDVNRVVCVISSDPKVNNKDHKTQTTPHGPGTSIITCLQPPPLFILTGFFWISFLLCSNSGGKVSRNDDDDYMMYILSVCKLSQSKSEFIRVIRVSQRRHSVSITYVSPILQYIKWSRGTHSELHRTTCQAMSESCMCHKCHKLLQNCPNLLTHLNRQ